MAEPLLIHTVEVQLGLVVAEELIEQQLGYLPWLLGENLAGQVDAWVMEQRLGYYPALDFFRGRPEAVDPALLTLIDQVVFFCDDYVRRELTRRLYRMFSRVHISRIQCLAYTLPKVRPSQGGAPDTLARHFSPNQLQLTIQLSSLQKAEFTGIEQLALDKLVRFARPAFAGFQVHRSRVLPMIVRSGS